MHDEDAVDISLLIHIYSRLGVIKNVVLKMRMKLSGEVGDADCWWWDWSWQDDDDDGSAMKSSNNNIELITHKI